MAWRLSTMKDFSKITEHIHKIFSENYPAGAEYDSRAPWNQEEGLSVVSFEPNFSTSTFEVNLSDGQSALIDFEPIIEQYFKEYPGSVNNFDQMFPQSDDIYADIVKYLIGQGYDFKYALENEVEEMSASGKIDYEPQEQEYEPESAPAQRQFTTTWRQPNNQREHVPGLEEGNTLRRQKYIIYKIIHSSEPPFYKNEIIDFAGNAELAKEKEDMYRNINKDPNVIDFFSEKPMPVQSRFHLNEKRR